MKESPPNIQKALFVAASGGLAIARRHGIETSGFEAYLTAHNNRVSALHRLRPEELKPQDIEYFQKMGAFVELAVELSPMVDQQR